MNLRMPKRNLTAGDVLATLLNPVYTYPGNQPGTLESYGTTADGHTFVIAVVELEEF